MRTRVFTWLTVMVAVAILGITCALKPSLLSPPTSPTTAAIPVPSRATAPTPSSGEAACAKIEGAARQEGKLVVYSFSLVGDSGLKVKENLRRATGLTLKLVTGGGASMI